MKAILIPPTKELDSFAHEAKMHLALAHLTYQTEYWRFYVNKKIAGDYIILDNSAHEFRKPISPSQLLRAARQVRADEIVLPDVPYKSEETIAATEECLKLWTKYFRGELEELRPQLMLVPQGDSIEEWRTCLFALILKWQRYAKQFPGLFRKEPPVIGLPAKYQGKFEGADIAKMLRVWLAPLSSNGYPIHLLGWRELWRLNELALEFPWIRSIDSAKPFVYGLKGIVFDPLNETEPAHIDRPEDYFGYSLSPHQRVVSDLNARVFSRLAKGNYKNGVKK